MGEILEIIIWICIIVALANGKSGAQRKLDQMRRDNNRDD